MIGAQHPFLKLVEQHSGAIEKICRSFCRTAEDCEDLRQDIVLRLWRGWQSYEQQGKTVTWVWRVAMNTAISYRRRQQRQVETTPLEHADWAEESASQEERELLEALIQRLPHKDQQLLRLYLDGWSHKEIGSLLDISESNVQTRISRIKQKLKEMAL